MPQNRGVTTSVYTILSVLWSTMISILIVCLSVFVCVCFVPYLNIEPIVVVRYAAHEFAV